MRPALAWAAAAALALPGCAALESTSKSSAPSASPPAPAPAPPAQTRPALQRQLSEREERRLRDEATRLLADAERATQGVRTDGLQPDQWETLGAIQDFLRQARQALAARDYDRATTLARKAQTLAEDLPQAQR